MSHFRLHSKTKGKDRLEYLIIGIVCVLAVGGIGYAAHSIGTASAKSREKILIYTEEELDQYLLDEESEEYNLNGRYQLEEDLELGWLWKSIGTNVEPFTGSFDGNGHVISGLTRPLFGVMKKASVENLFLSETMITNPCIYYDGEHYVDGYGALAAYVVDSEIANCGMGGEIQASNPVETWYQIEKASPAEALEWKELETTEAVIGPAGDETPGDETLEGTETEVKGPGVGDGAGNGETESSQADSSMVEGSQVESSQAEGSQPGNNQSESSQPESSLVENSQPENSQTDSDQTENSQNGSGQTGNDQAGSGQIDNGQPDSGQMENGQNSQPDNGQAGNGQNNQTGSDQTGDSQTGDKQSDKSQVDSSQTNNSSSGNDGVGNTTADNPVNEPAEVPETIAIQRTDRQYHMMKLSEVVGPDVETSVGEAADPTEATPFDAQEVYEPNTATPSEAEEEQENSYMGGDGEALYLAVTADRVAAGGLIAQLEGATTVTDCFTCATIITQIDVDTWTGGFAGRLGEAVHLENSYSSGVLDGCDRVGGFVADNQGRIENSYSSTALTMSGRVRGGFSAEGGGQLTGCVYDRQMACADDENGQQAGNIDGDLSIWERADGDPVIESPSDSAAIFLEARNTLQMSGIEEYIPGTWYQTDNAYPQIEYFALHENQIIADYSRVSAVTLILPETMTLQSVTLEEGQIILPEEMDGQAITWSVEGDIHIDDNHRIQMGSRVDSIPEAAETTETPTIPNTISESTPESVLEEPTESEIPRGPGFERPLETEAPRGPGMEEPAEAEASRGPGMKNPVETTNSQEPPVTISMHKRLLLTSVYENQETEASAPESESDNQTQKKAQIKAISGVAAKTYSLDINPIADTGVTYADWNAVGEAVYNNTNGMGIYKPTKGDGSTANPFEVATPEALAWFRYAVNKETQRYWCISLTDNIDLNGEKYNGGAGKLQWLAIDFTHPSNQTGYAGTFDGGGHAISNLYSSNGGLIGQSFDGTVRDLGIESGELTGALVGGIVAETAYVIAIGRDTKAYFERCYNKATIRAVDAQYPYAGGIVGLARTGTHLVDCYNMGQVSAVNNGERSASGIACYDALVENCYNTGKVFIEGVTDANRANGIATTKSTVRNSYSLEGMAPGNKGKELTEAQMKSWALAYKLNGESMAGPWTYQEGGYPGFGSPAPAPSWSAVSQGVKDGFVTAAAASTNAGGAYVIDTAEKLALFAYDVNAGTKATASASLTTNIDLMGRKYGGTADAPIRWTPIGTADHLYQGAFMGPSVIANMRVEQAGVGGLFGYVGGTMLYAVGLDASCSVTTTAPAAGGDSGTAAMVGIVNNDVSTTLSIVMCYSRASVSGHSSHTGAFVGQAMGSLNSNTVNVINSSYAAGALSTSSGTVGALAGNLSVGDSVGRIECSYWDQQTSSVSSLNAVSQGTPTLSGVGAKSTTEMKSDAILSLLNTNGSSWIRSDDRNNGYPSFSTAPTVYTSWEDVGLATPAPSSRYPSSSITPGTAGNPYLIKTAEDLAWFAYQVNNVSGRNNLCGELRNDINLYGSFYNGENAYDPNDSSATLDKALRWVPIGSDVDGKRYTGTFNGNGHTITAMLAQGSKNQGLFGTLGDNAVIRKTGIADSRIDSSGGGNGGIAGYVNGKGVEITECGNKGTLSGTARNAAAYFGGCAGEAASTSELILDGCYNVGTISVPGGNGIGGILGFQAPGGSSAGHVVIRNCMNRGKVEGGLMIGGIVGSAVRGAAAITGCYNAGVVSASGGYVGSIEANYTETAGADITDCLIDENYVYGKTSSTTRVVKSAALGTWGAARWLNGDSFEQSTGLSWTCDKDSPYPVLSATGLPPAENWEPVGEALEYGLIKDMEKPLGNGSTTPYQIQTPEQLAWFAWKVNVEKISASNQNIELKKDINLFGEKYSGYTGEKDLANIEKAVKWTPIGNSTAYYQGTFRGGRHEIDGMYLNGSSCLGLIGGGQYPMKIMELGIGSSCKTITTAGGSGLLVGTVNGANSPAEVISCYNLGTLIINGGNRYNGAIVGDDVGSKTNSVTVSNCYNAGNTASFAMISIGTIENCYADTSINPNNATHEKRSGSGVTSLATEEMKTSEVAASLNTYNGTLKTGMDRVWYTSLDTEKTKGYPTFLAPTTVKVPFTPDTMGADGKVETLPGSLSIPAMKLRAIGLTDENFTPGRVPTSDNDFQLVTEGSIKGTNSGYSSYGYANANKNVAVKAGSVDLQPVASSASLHNPVTELGTVDKVSLNIAAAYTRSTQRNLLLEGASGNDRYEICIAIAGAAAKTLSVTVPVRVPIELSPNGTKQVSHSADMTLTNNNVYPIAGRILSLAPIEQDGYVALKPVAKNDNYGSTKQISDSNGGVKLGIADTETPKGIVPSAGIYYTPAKPGVAENWMSYRIKGKGALPYRYFIEYEANPYYWDTNTYGFTVKYQFGISEQDAPAAAAVVGEGVSS